MKSSNANISTTFKNKNSNTNLLEIEGGNKEHKTKQVVKKVMNIIISKYGIVEDYRESKVIASRRMDLRGHTLTMVNVIADSNETKNHLDDRL